MPLTGGTISGSVNIVSGGAPYLGVYGELIVGTPPAQGYAQMELYTQISYVNKYATISFVNTAGLVNTSSNIGDMIIQNLGYRIWLSTINGSGGLVIDSTNKCNMGNVDIAGALV